MGGRPAYMLVLLVVWRPANSGMSCLVDDQGTLGEHGVLSG
jgi:hypothetical protein